MLELQLVVGPKQERVKNKRDRGLFHHGPVQPMCNHPVLTRGTEAVQVGTRRWVDAEVVHDELERANGTMAHLQLLLLLQPQNPRTNSLQRAPFALVEDCEPMGMKLNNDELVAPLVLRRWRKWPDPHGIKKQVDWWVFSRKPQNCW